MKRLWKYIPPCLSDVMGFQAIINETDGLGIVDDSSRYKPFPVAGNKNMALGGQGRPQYTATMEGRGDGSEGGWKGHGGGGFGGRGGDGSSEGGWKGHGGGFGGRGGNGGSEGGWKGHGGGFGGRGDGSSEGGWKGHGGAGDGARGGNWRGSEGASPYSAPGGKEGTGFHGPGFGAAGGLRIAQSDLRNEDIISGTEKKVVQAFEVSQSINPSFVLLANAPGSAMISSDLESAAEKINDKSGLPVGILKVYGDKDYIYGASAALEKIAQILMEKKDRQANTVNILGCNTIDWCAEGVNAFAEMLEKQGIRVISKWGAKGLTAEAVREAASASLNIVVNISGLKAAQYMNSEFGIPYIVGSPCGSEQCSEMLGLVQKALADPAFETGEAFLDREKAAEGADAIVIGEQLLANAVRRVLRARGYSNVRVLSFYEMDKAYMEPGDKKIVSEDELAAFAGEEGIRLIAADPDYKPAVSNAAKWINMPNSGQSMVTPVPAVNMVGQELDSWVDKGLA